METPTIIWQGITLEIGFERNFLEMGRAHLEVRSIQPVKAPMPFTPTGYRSAFPEAEAVDAMGGPVGYVQAWLDKEGKGKAWKARSEAERQLTLF